MEIDDLRALTDDELSEELNDSRMELMNLRFRVSTMQLPNVNQIRRVRKRIARVMTVMHQRDLARTAE